tara:strand:+ start:161 stop:295 length:135 start_codon:yes stop_codon:yes gene_type:complete
MPGPESAEDRTGGVRVYISNKVTSYPVFTEVLLNKEEMKKRGVL